MKHLLRLLRTCTLPLLAFVVPTVVWGQVTPANYTFGSSTGTFSAPVTGLIGTGGTASTTPAVAFTTSWDDNVVTYTLPSGFSFNFCGTSYTSVTLSANGFLVFGGSLSGNNAGAAYVSSSDPNGVYLSGTSTNNGFAGLNLDQNERSYTTFTAATTNGSNVLTSVSSVAGLRVGMRVSGTNISSGAIITAIGTSPNTVTISANATGTSASVTVTPRSAIYAAVSGTAPNRQLIFSFIASRRYNNATDNFDYQFILEETTNNLRVVYGQMTLDAAANGAQVGIRTTTANFNSRTTTTDWTATTASAANTDRCTISSTVFPASGTTFTWTAPNCVTPTSLAASVTPTPASFSSISGVFTAAPPTVPTGYLVVRTPTNVQPVPVNGTTYTVGTNAIGFIEYVGTAAGSWTSTGLASSTTYYYWVFSYNNASCLGGPVYSAGATAGNATTLSCPSYSGTITVGPSSTFTNLTQAISTLTTCGYSGHIVLELQSGYTSAGETFPLNVTNAIGSSASKTITVRPATGATGLSITGANAGATVSLTGVSFVTFDGRPGGTGSTSELTISNTNTGGQAFLITNNAAVSATNDTIRYCTLRGVNTNSASGVLVFSSTNASAANNSHLIEYCDIRDGATTPNNGVFVSGSSGTSDNNTIRNCNIYNYYGSGDQAGIAIASGASGWTISANSFYQTASRAGVASGFLYGVRIVATAGNFNVTGNYIGGTAPLCAGTPLTISSAASYRFQGIRMGVGLTNASNVTNNFIGNISWWTSSGSAANVFSGIYVSGGLVNVGNTSGTGNTIGGSAGNISIQLNTSNGISYGIVVESLATSAFNVSFNTISGITLTGSAAGVSTPFRGIDIASSSPSTVTIANNTIGSTSVANSIHASNASTDNTNGQEVTGIRVNVSGAFTISDNTIANLTNAYAGTATGGQTRGIAFTAGSPIPTVLRNEIYNLSNASANTGTAASASVIGIGVGSIGIGTMTIGQNRVYNLSNTNTTAAVAISGIVIGSTTTTNVVERNLIHSFSLASSGAGIIDGITASAGSNTTTYRNNMIRLGINAAGNSVTGNYLIRGFNKSGAGNVNLYHNSIYVGGTGVTTGTNNTAAFLRITTGTDDLRNNIFVNNRANAAGTGTHYAINYNNTTTLTSNYNVYLATGSGGSLSTVNSGVASQLTIANLRVATGGDANSVNADPQFINATGNAAAVDLHISASLATAIEGAGISIGSVTDDYDGETRSSLSPTDIGADAGNFTPNDISAPAIMVTAISSPRTATNTSLTGLAIITDGSGVETTLGLRPRLYYKKSSDANTIAGNTSSDNGWKFVESSNTSSPFDFTLNYAIINGGSVSVGDVIQYFVVAQDVVTPTPNVGWSGGISFVLNPSGSVALSAANFPVTGTSTFTITGTISGTYNVGTGETYTSLTGATGFFNLVNTSFVSGNLTVNITSDLTETGATALNQWSEEGAGGYTLTIQPSAASMRTITSSFVGGVIRLNGADRVTIDGRFGGSGNFLTINHTAATGTRAAVQLLSLGTGAGATNTTIRNVTFTQALGGTASYGVSAGGSTIGTAGADHDNLVIQDNVFTNANFSIYAEGTAAGLLDGLVISGNTLNSTVTAGTLAGIRVVQATSPTISANTISLETNQGNAPVGISLETGVTGAVVSRNRITKVLTTNSGGYGGRGITVATGSTSSNITIANNVIYGVNGSNWTGFDDSSSMGIGIGVLGTTGTLTTVTGGVNLYYNSVNMYGTYSRNESSNTTALYVGSAASALDIRNNVLVNTLVNTNAGGTGAKNYAIFSVAANTAYTTINHNLYFAPGTQGVLGRINGVDRTDLSGLQSGFGGNANSVVGDPLFASNTNLIPGTSAPVLAVGTPVPGITTDFIGDSRSLTAPSIGAYENGADISGPIITYTALGNTTSVANRSLSATITDVSGVNGTTAKPRIYFKKSTDANAFVGNTSADNGWKFVEATNAASPFDFVIDYALINGGSVTGGDIVQYFVVAQDLASTPNVGQFPALTFASAPTSVALVAGNFPTTGTPSSYNITPSFAGTYNVGTGETYTSLTGAGGLFAAINAGTLTGNVTVNITSDLTETGATALNQWTEEGVGGYTLTIQPSAATTRIISNSGNLTTAMIGLNGADRVTIDGRSGGSGSFLRFVNTHTTAGSGQAVLSINNGSTNITVRNASFEANTTSTTAGTIVIGTTGTNQNISFIANTIRDAVGTPGTVGAPLNAVYSAGSANNNNIAFGGATAEDGNSIFNFTTGGITLGTVGDNITVRNNAFYQTATRSTTMTMVTLAGSGNNHNISDNSIGGSNATRGGTALTTNALNAISVACGSTTATVIARNAFGNITTNATSGVTQAFIQVTAGRVTIGGSSSSDGNIIGDATANNLTFANTIDGILIPGTSAVNATIQHNTVRNILYQAADFERVAGVHVSNTSASTVFVISNNTIRDLLNKGTTTVSFPTAFAPHGISIVNAAGTGNVIADNTIFNITLDGNAASDLTSAYPNMAGIYVNGPVTVSVQNNRIYNLINNRTGTGTNAPVVAGILTSGAAAVAVSNNQVTLTSSVGQPFLRGIHHGSTGTSTFFYNSIYVGGTAAGTNNTAAFYLNATSGTNTVRNNIFYNERGGTGNHFAMGRVTSGNFTTVSHNLLVTANAANTGDNAGTAQTFSTWNTTISQTAALNNTVSELPSATLFPNLASGDLSTTNCRVADAGTVVAVTTDFTGAARSGSTPDLGSTEFATPTGAIGTIGSITGSASIEAPATGANYSIAAVANAISYNWTYSGTGLTITAGTGTNDITVSFAANATSGTLSVTATNACGTTTAATLAITVGGTTTWDGSAWDNGTPTSSRDAIINGNYAVGTGFTARSLTFNNGFSFALANGQTLTTAGNWTNNGTSFTDNNTGTGGVVFNGTSAQTIGGTASTSFRNVELNNSNGLSISVATNVTGALTLTSGTLTTSGNLTLKSTSETATATVVGGTNSSISGNVTIERFFKLNNAATGGGDYKFFSQPLQSNIQFSAVTGLGANATNVILLNEAAINNSNAGTGWVGAGGASATMTRGRGYAHWITADKTISYTGAPQLSDFTTSTITYTAANAPNDGFNLIGNPFPAVVDLDVLTRNNVAATYYVYNHTTDAYWTWTAGAPGLGTGTGNSQYIAPGQAFIVKATSATSPSVTFPASARVSNVATHFRTAQPVRLTLQSADGLRYETAIRFGEGATAQYDDEFDALFFPGSRATTPKFATVSGERRLVLNSLPELAGSATVPVYLEIGSNGRYTLHFEEGNLEAGVPVYLADRATGEMIDLRVRPVYAFEATTADRKDRFALHFGARQVSVEAALADAFYAYPLKGAVGLSISDLSLSGEVEVLDVSGRVISAAVRFAQGGTMTIELPQATAGVYLVRIRTDKGMAVKRVVLE